MKTNLFGFVTALLLMSGAPSQATEVTHGVMAAEVTDSRAIIWSRTDTAATMFVSVKPNHGNGIRSVRVQADDDYTGQVVLRNLRPNTHYTYEVWFSKSGKHYGKKRNTVRGEFRTPPAKRKSDHIRIAWSGDFAGQNVCRDLHEGFPIFDAIVAEKPDVFVGLGDMIYADNLCEETGRYGNAQVPGNFDVSADLPNFWAHWRYSREDEAFKKLLAKTAYYGIWDDHEVVNDFGPLADTRDTPPYTAGENLLPIGLEAYLDYTPMISDRKRTPHRLYRNVRWGKHAELFFLDNRQYRDANLAADSEDRQKSMLGREQLVWLQKRIEASNATWKIIVSSVPISIPTGFPQDLGRDGWANFDENTAPTVDGIPQSDTGFEEELIDILRTLQETGSNTMFITTDVHFAEVFRYTPFQDDPSFVVHEFVIGPGNAGIFPNQAFDMSLSPERLFFHGPDSFLDVTSWEEAKVWFNYGVIDIDRHGFLTARVNDTVGDKLYELALTPR